MFSLTFLAKIFLIKKLCQRSGDLVLKFPVVFNFLIFHDNLYFNFFVSIKRLTKIRIAVSLSYFGTILPIFLQVSSAKISKTLTFLFISLCYSITLP